MTALSRPRRGGDVKPPRKAAWTRVLAWWHVACIPVLASGCFYLGPMPTIEYNLPPEILRAEPEVDPDEALLIGPAGETVFVLAKDPEGDPIRFTWWLTGDGILGNSYPVYGEQGSQIDLEYDDQLDGKTLSCLLDDGQNDLVELTWHLEVL